MTSGGVRASRSALRATQGRLCNFTASPSSRSSLSLPSSRQSAVSESHSQPRGDISHVMEQDTFVELAQRVSPEQPDVGRVRPSAVEAIDSDRSMPRVGHEERLHWLRGSVEWRLGAPPEFIEQHGPPGLDDPPRHLRWVAREKIGRDIRFPPGEVEAPDVTGNALEALDRCAEGRLRSPHGHIFTITDDEADMKDVSGRVQLHASIEDEMFEEADVLARAPRVDGRRRRVSKLVFVKETKVALKHDEADRSAKRDRVHLRSRSSSDRACPRSSYVQVPNAAVTLLK